MRQVRFWAVAPLMLLNAFSPASWVMATNLGYTPAKSSHSSSILLAQRSNCNPEREKQVALAYLNQARQNPQAAGQQLGIDSK